MHDSWVMLLLQDHVKNKKNQIKGSILVHIALLLVKMELLTKSNHLLL